MRPESLELVQQIIAETNRIFEVENSTHYFNIQPRVAQRIEDRVQQSNAFLAKINNHAVPEISGEVLGFGVPGSITKRTSTADQYGKKRRPTDPTNLVQREYKCHEVEQDAWIGWNKIDSWVHLADFYGRYRQNVLLAQATDRLKVGWNGQWESADTDPALYPGLEDVETGWLQFLINEAPENVLGISPDPVAPGGYTVDQINVGPGAGANGYETLDELVFHMRQTLLHRLFRRRNGMKVILGDELLVDTNQKLFGTDHAPTERLARNLYLSSQTFGRTDIEESDEFPMRGVFLTELSNLSRYWQESSMRRKIDDQHDVKGIVDYNFVREDFVIEFVEGAAAVHPDAIHLKDKSGNWVPVSETWKKAPA